LPQTFERVDDSLLGSFSLVYLFGYVNSRDTVALSQPPVGTIVAIRKIKSGPTHFGGPYRPANRYVRLVTGSLTPVQSERPASHRRRRS
jgi:hypothetical protein